ncbi:unnamed protein product [Schistocephalus solidus]|uniref:C2H2-type domain-containing protein n=1 Tax=Schistocephalus solidus TaxID=70667 RepID=A0A183SK41_SCHSO|nr:unnamed protein product [Schistocephalus solidus]
MVTASSQLHLSQHGVDAEDSSPLQDFRVRDLVLPSQLQYSAEEAEMEVIQLPGMACLDGPYIPTSASTSANPPSDSPTPTPGINYITPIIETTSQYSWPVTPTTANTTTVTFTTTTAISDGDSLLNCPQCDCTFTSRIGLIGHLRSHHTETGEPVPGAPTHSRDRRFHCPHCPRAFTHRMGLFSHMRIHDSGIHRNADNTDIPCTPSAPAIRTATATPLP